MTKKYLRIDENTSGDIIFYEGDTVVFEVEATRYYRHWSDLNYYQPGENFSLFRNGNSSLTKFDIQGYPESFFSHTTIGSDGFARWEYTFLDDGIKEGFEEMTISRSNQSSSGPGVYFNLVISDLFEEGQISLTDSEALKYIASHGDLIDAFKTDKEAAKSHYIKYGKSEGRPLDDFDEWGYLASNIGLIAPLGTSPTEAIKHYILYGNVEGRSTTIFNAQSYLNNYSDLKSAFGNDHTLAAKHYVENGFYEGRVF